MPFATHARDGRLRPGGCRICSEISNERTFGGRESSPCRVFVVDSMLVPCIRQFYPVTFYVAVAAICVLLGALMYPKRRF
jgi:hypothetical protein